MNLSPSSAPSASSLPFSLPYPSPSSSPWPSTTLGGSVSLSFSLALYLFPSLALYHPWWVRLPLILPSPKPIPLHVSRPLQQTWRLRRSMYVPHLWTWTCPSHSPNPTLWLPNLKLCPYLSPNLTLSVTCSHALSMKVNVALLFSPQPLRRPPSQCRYSCISPTFYLSLSRSALPI